MSTPVQSTNEILPLDEYKDLAARSVSKLEKTTSEDFWLLRAKLEGEGFKYVGKKPNDEASYKKHLEDEKVTFETHKKAREAYNFKTCVEEAIFQYVTQGYEVITTQAFDDEGNKVDYTSFFIRKKGADQQELLKKIKTLEEEAQKNYDLYLRTNADVKNTMSRLKREKEEHTKYANTSLIKEILPAIDNMYRVIEHAKKDPAMKSLTDGVEITLNGLLNTLKKQGLEEVVSTGEPFNPEYHEAVSMQQHDSIPKGYVVAELQKGYTLNGRLVRASAVIVSSGKE